MSARIQQYEKMFILFELCLPMFFHSFFFIESVMEVFYFYAVLNTQKYENCSQLINIIQCLHLFFSFSFEFCNICVISSWTKLITLPFECVNFFWAHSMRFRENSGGRKESKIEWTKRSKKKNIRKEHHWNTHITRIPLLCTNWMPATIRK